MIKITILIIISCKILCSELPITSTSLTLVDQNSSLIAEKVVSKNSGSYVVKFTTKSGGYKGVLEIYEWPKDQADSQKALHRETELGNVISPINGIKWYFREKKEESMPSIFETDCIPWLNKVGNSVYYRIVIYAYSKSDIKEINTILETTLISIIEK